MRRRGPRHRRCPGHPPLRRPPLPPLHSRQHGHLFQVPWTRINPWPGALATLREAGFHTAALALSEDSVALEDFAAHRLERLALILGTEGDGLAPATTTAADTVVRIPMDGGVDSLNVAAASAVAFWATGRGAPQPR